MQDFSQLGRREAIRLLFEGSKFEPFGDCSFVPGDGRKAVAASRLMLEGIDFDLVYFPLKHLGYKSVVCVTGELYAAQAVPETLAVRLGLSAKLDFEQVKELWSGILAATEEFGYSKLSLDLQPSQTGLTISVNACGAAPLEPLAAPASKDLLCITGRPGAAYFGLQVLEKGKTAAYTQKELERYRMLVAAYLRPELPAALPAKLAESGITPSAACLVDRGLADALLRLTAATGLGAKVYADRIPFESGSFELGKSLDIDPVSAAMNGGEDFCILFAVPISQYEALRHDFQAFDIIGHLAQTDVGAVLVTPDGLEHSVSAPGWPSQENN